jgi:hypothetical protein
MDLSKILAITGKPGLYKVLAQTKSGFVVESLLDSKRFPVFAHERVSSLEEISIFSTGEEDLHLKDVFKLIFDHQEGKQALDAKSDPKTLKAYFDETIPAYDPERVYLSDMKKVINWYNLLVEKQMMDFTEEAPGGEEKAEKQETEVPEVESEEKKTKKETKSR